jgi:hypothetical protein
MPKVRFRVALIVVIWSVALWAGVSPAGAKREYRPIARVWVRSIVQRPYQPVSFVIDFSFEPSARLDQDLTVSYRVTDAAGNLDTPKLKVSDIFQTPYRDTEMTLT